MLYIISRSLGEIGEDRKIRKREMREGEDERLMPL
jgi:hypothetical protein